MTLLTDTLAALLWVGGAILLVLGVHRAARRFMPRPGASDADGQVYPAVVRDMASATGFRIAAFHGVILALVYAHELGEYQTVLDGLAAEATAIADVFYDAGPFTAPLRTPPGAFERLLETDICAAPVIARAEIERRAAGHQGTTP